jgi:membrane-bound PQQ-dependent dehydrogenase (glucose/quinate/shikimate family)
MKTAVRCAAIVALGVVCLFVIRAASGQHGDQKDEWPVYGHDPGGMRFSPLTQITRENVAQLKVAWTFHTGDISNGSGGRKRTGFETTPILIDGTLYLTTGFNRVIALDPETGKQRWSYDPLVEQAADYGDGMINRGVATWLDAARAEGKLCHRRIFEATLDARLIALDAATGAPCPDFGASGQVSLRKVARYLPGQYHMTSTPTIIGDIVVVGSAINDNSRVDMPSGVVRGFDARTGALLWSWEPLPPNEPSSAENGGKTWRTGAGNAWSTIVADPERGLVFVPTGSPSPDYYGGLRLGDDKWADSVVALRAKTGELVWGFQLVHHNLWDFDTASPPLLTTIVHEGKRIPVVIQGNKTGFLYVLNRDTGVPVFPVEERAVPKSDIPGEVASATQPFPVAPPALVPQHFSADDAWGITPADREACRAMLQGLRNEGVFTPPSVQGTLTVPGNVGGMNWSGYAFDPQHGLLVVNVNNLPAGVRMISQSKIDADSDNNTDTSHGEYGWQRGAPYGMFRQFIFSPSGLPCVPPPWGTLAAVDMATGKIRWQVPLGEMAPGKPVPPGSINLGGPITTASGLVFISGTWDPFIRAFDVETGKEIWKAQLPAGGHAMPMTYQMRSNGKQYVVIAAGGHAKLDEQPQGDSLVAFTLP